MNKVVKCAVEKDKTNYNYHQSNTYQHKFLKLFKQPAKCIPTNVSGCTAFMVTCTWTLSKRTVVHLPYFLEQGPGPLFPSAEFTPGLYLRPASNQGPAFIIFVSSEREGEDPWHKFQNMVPHTSHHGCCIPDVLSVSSAGAETTPNNSSDKPCPCTTQLC